MNNLSNDKIDVKAGGVVWRLVSVPIYVKVFGIGLFISLLFASIAFYVMRSSVLQAHYQARGEMAFSLAVSLASHLQSGAINNKTSMDYDLKNVIDAFPSVRYILVQDMSGNLLAHRFAFPGMVPVTFIHLDGELCATCHSSLLPKILPTELLEVPEDMSLPEGSLRAYHRDEGLILEVKVPIDEGRLGTLRLGVVAKKVSDDLTMINQSILAGIALCMIATLCSAMLLTYVLNKPIRGLLKATSTIAEGDFGARAPVYSDDELGRLAKAFNKMAERLAESQSRILRSNRLSSIGQFALGMAHEINNPLDGILNCLERLRREPANLSQNLEYLEMIKHALLRISCVIQRLLEYSQQRKMNQKPEDIRTIINHVIALISVASKNNNVDVVSDFADELPLVNCDRHYLEQVFLNLALNSMAAIKESSQNRLNSEVRDNITFRVAAHRTSNGGSLLQIDVSDTGMGIAQKNLNCIFEAFFTTKGQGEGTGLGLAIVKEIIEAHSGSVEVESAPGKGTVFQIFLPAWNISGENDSTKETWEV